eukprot:982587-Amphidinium_carterae.1
MTNLTVPKKDQTNVFSFLEQLGNFGTVQHGFRQKEVADFQVTLSTADHSAHTAPHKSFVRNPRNAQEDNQ